MPPSSSTSPSLSASPYPPQPHPPPHSAAAGGPRRTDSEHSTVSPMAPDSVTVEGPRPEWEPSRPHDLSDTRQRATNSGVGGARNISFTDGADSEVDRGMEWSWRRQKPGWCLASDERDARGGFGVDGSSSSRHSRAGTRGAGGSSRSRYMGGWMSSFGVWLGIKSVTLEVRESKGFWVESECCVEWEWLSRREFMHSFECSLLTWNMRARGERASVQSLAHESSIV